MNLALDNGVPYEHCGHGLMCLLGKDFRSIYIDKLSTICLLKADFLQEIQKAVTEYARIILVVGGSLKPAKCQASVTSFRFIQQGQDGDKERPVIWCHHHAPQ